MIARRAAFSLAAAGLGLGSIALPAPALAQNTGVLPADPQDFQCFVLLQQRRGSYVANQQMDAAERAEVVNNLTIISAYFAGRISHYSSADAVAQFQTARAQIDGATPEQRDAFAGRCANFYLAVMNVLTTSGQQNAPAPGAQ